MIIKNKKQLEFYIQSDRIMAGIDNSITLKERLLNQFYRIIGAGGTRDIQVYFRYMRCYNYYSNIPQKNIIEKICEAYYNFRYSQYGIKCGFSIGKDCFGYGLHIPHFGSVIVNSKTKVGNFAFLNAGSCIGGGGKIIGNGLYMGTSSQIQGHDIHIGDYVSISALSLVTKDAFDGMSNLLLAGVPVEIKKTNYLPWWEANRDAKWAKRVSKVLELKRKMNIDE